MLAARALSIARRSRGLRVGVAPADPGRGRDLADQLGEDLAALGVDGALLALDRRPLGVAGHGRTDLARAGPSGQRPRAKSRSRSPGSGLRLRARSADTGAWERARLGPPEEPMADAVAIGIDLGTSNSCVAVATRSASVEVLPNAFGESITASVVALPAKTARSWSATPPRRASSSTRSTPSLSAKRLIGRYFFSEEVKKAQAVCSLRDRRGRRTTASASRSATSSSRCPRSRRWCCAR